MDDSDHHVHFNTSEEDEFGEKSIEIEHTGPNSANVRLGFLSVHHMYKVEVRLPMKPQQQPDSIQQTHLNPPTLNCRFLKARFDGERHEVIVSLEFLATKPGIQKETVQLQQLYSGYESTTTTLTLIARVMGKGKGTPLLRVGVHLLNALDDPDESDANSDWKGF